MELSQIIGIPLCAVNRHPFGTNRHTQGMSDIGTRLRYARKKRKLSQVKLASLSGVKQGSISDLERNESKAFRGNTLVSVANALRVNPEWLAHGKGSMERQNIPLSDRAVSVAQAFDRIGPEMQEKIAAMILAMAEQEDKFGTESVRHNVPHEEDEAPPRK